MRTFTLQQSRTEVYTPHGGLALVGHCLNRHTSLIKTARTVAKRHGIPNIELIRTYLGLITLGKSDFEAAEPVRTDPFFKSAMGIKQSPSSARLRQRFDEDAQALTPLLEDASVEFLQSVEAPVSPLAMGHVALDMDVFPMDNSQTHKEGVSYTYKGYDGYAPIAAYLGQEGWCLGCELRPGSQHANNGFLDTLKRVLPRARSLTDKPILLRLDSAHDARDNRDFLREQDQIDFLIKWNPRKQDPLAWADKAQAQKAWTLERDGKMEAVLSEDLPDEPGLRRIVKVTVRTSDAAGQLYLEPEVSLEGWITSLPVDEVSDQQVMALYSDHATSEQFHSEFKTDLGPGVPALRQVRHQQPGHGLRNDGVQRAALDGPEADRPGCAGAPPGQTPSPENGDAGTDDHGLSPGAQWPAMDTEIWPTLSRLYGLPRPLSRPCFLWIGQLNHWPKTILPESSAGQPAYCLNTACWLFVNQFRAIGRSCSLFPDLKIRVSPSYRHLLAQRWT